MKRREDRRRRGTVKDKLWTKKESEQGHICIFKIDFFLYFAAKTGSLFNGQIQEIFLNHRDLNFSGIRIFVFWSFKIIKMITGLC